MWNKLKAFLSGNRTDFGELLRSGAKVVDVRTPSEFRDGHFPGAVNIPVDRIGEKLHQLKKEEVIIVCCRSGMRSAAAKRVLQGKGFTRVHNAGPWTTLRK